MAKPDTEDLRRRVIRYAERGRCKAEAARRFSVSYRSVERWLQRYEATHEVLPKRVGRSPAAKMDRAKLAASVAADSDQSRQCCGLHRECLAPTLTAGQIVMLDDTRFHQASACRSLIEERKCSLKVSPGLFA
jgi:transposase